MNAIYANIVKKDLGKSLLFMGFFICLITAILLLQGLKYSSSLWVLINFSYSEWKEYLDRVLSILFDWSIVTGIFFSIQFFIRTTTTKVKEVIKSVTAGFIIGFTFSYLMAAGIAIILFIPLGILSLFMTEIIKYATFQFTFLVATYLVVILIFMDAPKLVYFLIKEGNWYFKILGILGALLLINQILMVIISGYELIIRNSFWRTRLDAFILATVVSLIVSVILTAFLERREKFGTIVFISLGIYIFSIIAGNISENIFHWGELPSALTAAFCAPIVFSLVVKIMRVYGIGAIFGILGLFGGAGIGFFVDWTAKYKIIGQNWTGILCGTMLTVGIGVSFGLVFANLFSGWLVNRFRIRPYLGCCVYIGLIAGIVIGMVAGGFIQR
jgi:hypothetical protein